MAKEIELLDDEKEALEAKRMTKLEKKFGHIHVNRAGKERIVEYSDSVGFYCLCPEGHRAYYDVTKDVYRCAECGWTSPVLDENQGSFVDVEDIA